MDAFEAMGTAVSMRWLKPDPVPDELVDRLLWAATRASNPGNVQPWEFVVVRDEQTRRDVAEIMTSKLDLEKIRRDAANPLPDNPTQRRLNAGVSYLVEHLGDAPVIIFLCGKNVFPPNAPQEHMMYSAVFGAAQNLMVAARASGLGAAYTTFHIGREDGIKVRLEIPAETTICVTVPVGWPGREYGNLTRKPIEAVVHRDHW
jgi:nitroreductase